MAYPISNVSRRVQYTGSAGVGPYSFTFEILANTDIAVYKNTTLLTLTTDYTVTINSNGTGSVTLVSAATGSDTVTIYGSRALQRTSDFVTGGDLFANTLNDELDSLVIFTQQNKEEIDRSLQAPVTDPTTIDMTLPGAALRAGKLLAFNATTGNAEAGPDISNFTGIYQGSLASAPATRFDTTALQAGDLYFDTTSDSMRVYTGGAWQEIAPEMAIGHQAYTATAGQTTFSVTDGYNTSSVYVYLNGVLLDAADYTATNGTSIVLGSGAALNDTVRVVTYFNPVDTISIRNAAAASAAAAATSASNASTSATNAASSASTASTQASNASTSATNAANSATAASGSASTASTAATNASNSATAAATSATSASNSGSSASTSATNAASSASSASTSATNASNSASSASSSASTATTQASNATSAASNAASSALNALISVNAAANSATAAAASAAAAAASFDAFDDIYLGAKSSDPSVDNDGNALTTGDQYFNTVANELRIWNGSAWQAAAVVGGTVNTIAVNTSATLNYGTANAVAYLNGSKVITTGSALVFDGTNLGVGTTSPAYKLDVSNTSAGAYVVSRVNNLSATGYTRLLFEIGSNGANGSADISYVPGTFFAVGPSSNDTTTPIVFRNNNATERARIDSSGNLGLGVTPSAWGSSWKATQSGAVGALASTGSGSTVPTAVVLGAYNDNTNWKYQYTGVGAARYEMTGANAGSTHAWYISAGGTAGNAITFTQAMTLDSSGNLLVGTTTASYLLTQGMVVKNPNDIETYVAVGHKTGSGSGSSFFIASYNGGLIGNITQNGTTGVSYNTSSDYRLKNIDGPLTGSGAFIDALKPKSGTWKADGSKFVGFLAHEVQEVSPGSVVGEKDGEQMQAMEYGSAEFIANIIAELQSLRARVAQLEGQ